MRHMEGVFGGCLDGSDAASLAAEFAGVVDEDLANELGGDGEEVGAASSSSIGQVLCDEAQVGFLDQGGGLEGAWLDSRLS